MNIEAKTAEAYTTGFFKKRQIHHEKQDHYQNMNAKNSNKIPSEM